MSQPHETDDDREPAVTPEQEAPDPDRDDVQGHVITGALQDNNQQP